MTYYIYENWTHNKAKVHYADCGSCKHGKGAHTGVDSGKHGRWHGPFETLDKAIEVANQTGQPASSCGLCNPF